MVTDKLLEEDCISMGFHKVAYGAGRTEFRYTLGFNKILTIISLGTLDESVYLSEYFDDFIQSPNVVCIHNHEQHGYLSKAKLLKLLEFFDCEPKKEEDKLMEDEEYIKSLEGMVWFLSSIYEKLKETYFDSHMRTCASENPERRELTEAENREWMRFTLVEGGSYRDIISRFANCKKPMPSDIDRILERYK